MMKKTIKLKKCKKLKDVLSQAKGLMFSKKVAIPLIFVFKRDTKFAFHSLFCPKFDIIFLNENKEVVNYEAVDCVKRIVPKESYRYVVEVPFGFIKKNKIKKKTQIEFD